MSTSHLQLFQDEPVKVNVDLEDYLFKANDPANGKMYILLKGEVEIWVNEVMVERAQPGAIIGELALIDHEARSASIRCISDCIFAEIDEKRFQALIHDTPFFALEVMKVLTRRLRHTSKLL